MDPNQIRDIKRLKRINNSYMAELTNGKVSKRFKSVEFDLVQEYFDNINNDEGEVPDTDAKKQEEIAIENKQESEDEPEVFEVRKLKERLKRFLKPAETVSQAMRRLRGTVQKKANFKKNVRKGSKDLEKVTEGVNEEFEELCKVCSDLIAAECDDLYEWKLEDLIEVRYWKLKGPNGVVGPVNDQQIKIWKDGKKLKGFKIQKTDKQGNSLQADNWMDFDLFELY